VTPDAGDLRRRDIALVVAALGEGEVTTYGDVADVAGHPGRARLVGRILAAHDPSSADPPVELPWWRVVAAGGRLRAGDPQLQAQLLRSEGVEVVDGRVRDAPIGRFRRTSP
jgi:methylated-DNA-protein-cysteine methyltransferase-like protein